MSKPDRPNSLHPALMAGLTACAVAIFFPWFVVFIVGFVVNIHNPETAADAIQRAAFWLVVLLLCAEYAIRRDRARVR